MHFTLNLLPYSIKKPRKQLFIPPGTTTYKSYRPKNNSRSVGAPRSSSTSCRKKKKSHNFFFWGGGIFGIFRSTSKYLHIFILQLLVDPPLGNTVVCLPLRPKHNTTWPAHRIPHDLFSLIFGAAYKSQGHFLQPQITACAQNSGFNKR